MYRIDLRKYNNIEAGVYGDYTVLKEIHVISPADVAPANGILIQKVTKRPNVMWVRRNKNGILGPVKRLTTGDQIAAHTNHQVQHMDTDYFEIFDISGGEYPPEYNEEGNEIGGADSFQSGPIVEYKRNQAQIDDDFLGRDIVFTRGTINHVGTCVFYPRDHPRYEEIRGLAWDDRTDLPANGLPYLPYSPALDERIFANPLPSNIVRHIVNVSWEFPREGGPDPAAAAEPPHTSIIESRIQSIRTAAAARGVPLRPAAGGRRRTQRNRRTCRANRTRRN